MSNAGDRGAPICVGVDASAGSRDALALARLLAGHLGAPLVAVYVETRDKRGEFDASEVDADLRTVQAESGAEGLRRFGESEGASLLVVGSSSRTGLGRLRPGETATRLFSSASIGVAVAPLGYADRDGQLSIVGCGYDGGAGAGSALQWAVALCLMRPETQLEVLSAVPRLAFGGATVGALPSRSAQQALETEIQRDLDAAVKRAGNPSAIRAVRLAGDPVLALVRESERLDLLVLGSRGRGPARSVMLGRVSAEVVRAAACPVVVVPPPV
jgi:nucleotide-binding universal stress UspA family protein